jgi:hypothetical protein
MAGLGTAFDNPALDPVTGLPKTGTATPWVGTQSQVDDSVASHVAKLVGDSKLNQMARTEGLKAANSRGLLNSSMAVGAAQDAVIKNALPIAAQDAGQAFQKNQAARGFEYGMTAQEAQQGFQSGERIAGQGFATTQAALDRELQTSLQANQITSAEQMQYRQIASTEGIEAASRKLQADLQEKDIQFRMSEGGLDRAAAVAAQQADIAFRTSEGTATRALQEQIANMNLTASQQQAASSLLLGMEGVYSTDYQSIMANTDLSASQRDTLLTAAKGRRNTMLNLVEQMYNVDLTW